MESLIPNNELNKDVLKLLAFRVKIEAKEGMQRFGVARSAHECLGIIQEEFEELKQEVYKNKAGIKGIDNPIEIYDEAMQVAATAMQMMYVAYMVLIEGGGGKDDKNND